MEQPESHVKRNRLLSIAAGLAIVAGGGLIWMTHTTGGTNIQAGILNFFSHGSSPSPAPDPDAPQQQSESGTERYLDPEYRFSFEYPSDFTVQHMDEENGGETLLVQKDGDKQGFQIFISAFDEDMTVVTPDRVHKDLPDMAVDNPQEIILSNDKPSSAGATAGKHALMFFSEDSSLGKTREVWVIDGGYLYQISTYAEFDTWLAGIMKTFTFGTESAE